MTETIDTLPEAEMPAAAEPAEPVIEIGEVPWTVRRGTVVHLRQDDQEGRLAMVSRLGPGDGDVRLWTVSPDTGEITYHFASPEMIEAPATLLADDEWLQVQRLIEHLNTVAERERNAYANNADYWQQEAQAAHGTIDAMRAYAIRKHVEGDICRPGLDAFLEAHDLEPYQPSYTATVSLTFQVRIDDAGNSDDVGEAVRRELDITSDEDQVTITGEIEPEITDITPIS